MDKLTKLTHVQSLKPLLPVQSCERNPCSISLVVNQQCVQTESLPSVQMDGSLPTREPEWMKNQMEVWFNTLIIPLELVKNIDFLPSNQCCC